MSGEVTTFATLPIGGKFMCNGNPCIKRSSRTAELINFNRVFYFGKREIVTIGHP
jgi:hypothetical protein